ncbi:hypothetical protein QC761_0075430 [Podospora bellae-mahoneyi]|uniref:Uncharacterized protein n=1 Tax=Podospora bellae-mahoneyi TaxID=2093777 RepID=A0ABR0FCR7_9PEZI|nr:hypothetical protein QC761_0075430 [Podospora bellae-mahoneyi]
MPVIYLHRRDHEFEQMDNAIIEVENDKERCQVQVLERFCTRRSSVGIDEQRIKRAHPSRLATYTYVEVEFNILDGATERSAKPLKKLESAWRRKRELQHKKEMLELAHRICDKVVNVEYLIHILHKKTPDRKA